MDKNMKFLFVLTAVTAAGLLYLNDRVHHLQMATNDLLDATDTALTELQFSNIVENFDE